MTDEQQSPVMHDEDWIPDDCPPEVARLIANDQMLETMGLRGLASANSKEIAASMRRLEDHLRDAEKRGRDDGYVGGRMAGFEAGMDDGEALGRKIGLRLGLYYGGILGALLGAAIFGTARLAFLA